MGVDNECEDCGAVYRASEGHECESWRLLNCLRESREAFADAGVRLLELEAQLNTPETAFFLEGVKREAAHQRARWGSEHDEGKEPSDWFWLLGYLSGKALAAHIAGNIEKALHHTISSAAALANWHAALLGKTNMRTGIETPKGEGDGAGSQ